MDRILKNRFIVAFIAFMVVGVGVLSYLLSTSYSHYDEVAQQYDKQVKELNRLQQIKPYPDDKGLKKFTELRQNYATEVSTLQTKLAAFEPPPENPPPTPIQFADKLRKVVEDVTNQAQNVGMALPEGFYMGFEQYRSSPPDAAAAPLLSQELDSIKDLMQMLLRQHVERLNAINRGHLPHEAGGPAAPSSSGTAGRPAGEDLVVRYPVEINFTSQPTAFQAILNQITTADRLYIIRTLQVKNQSDKGPVREDPSAAVAGGVVPPGAFPPPSEFPNPDQNGVPVPPLPKKGPAPLRYVVGLEKVETDMRIELVKVAPPSATLAATR